ncbi:hypothetical protein BHM03_00043618 [Ensete ventricosum]|nr:hypothetical protein BHM03_00043618 [Ensete ventricosum]
MPPSPSPSSCFDLLCGEDAGELAPFGDGQPFAGFVGGEGAAARSAGPDSLDPVARRDAVASPLVTDVWFLFVGSRLPPFPSADGVPRRQLRGSLPLFSPLTGNGPTSLV